MAGWVTWQQQIWAADKGGGEGGSPSWPVLLWCPEASRAASLLCCQPMSLSRTALTLSQLQSLHHSILTLPALTHPTRTGFLLKHTGYLLSCQLQMNLSVLGTCGGVWNGMADDWVLLDVSLLQSKQAQTEIKTEPIFCLPSQLSHTECTSQPKTWRFLWYDRPTWAEILVHVWGNRQQR